MIPTKDDLIYEVCTALGRSEDDAVLSLVYKLLLMFERQQLLQQTPCTTQLPPTYAVKRVEVIDEDGRSYVNWDKKNCVEVQLQDESRTMKVFISRR